VVTAEGASWAPAVDAASPYLQASLSVAPADKGERLFGLGQGGWTGEGCLGCPTLPPSTQMSIPLQRNGQWVNLQQRKFHVSIPFIFSTGSGMAPLEQESCQWVNVKCVDACKLT
jgi:hypothetical protein